MSKNNQIKVLLVDDETLIRQGLALLLGTDGRLEIIGQASDGEEAIAACEELQPQVVLMDIRMPQMDGREATRQIKEKWPHIQVLVLTTFSDLQYIKEAMNYGASGYLLKDSSPELIVESILAVSKGSVVIHPQIANQVLQNIGSSNDNTGDESPSQNTEEKSPEDFGLTESEAEILTLVASGHSNKEIAENLFLSEGTIKNKITNILQKLDLRDRTQLAIFAWKHGLH